MTDAYDRPYATGHVEEWHLRLDRLISLSFQLIDQERYLRLSYLNQDSPFESKQVQLDIKEEEFRENRVCYIRKYHFINAVSKAFR